jgi:hypothetical protein
MGCSYEKEIDSSYMEDFENIYVKDFSTDPNRRKQLVERHSEYSKIEYRLKSSLN